MGPWSGMVLAAEETKPSLILPLWATAAHLPRRNPTTTQTEVGSTGNDEADAGADVATYFRVRGYMLLKLIGQSISIEINWYIVVDVNTHSL